MTAHFLYIWVNFYAITKINMKNLKISVAILVASTFVVSCSKSDVFEQNQSSVNDLKMNQYKTSFVQKYGAIAPDQSWDFSTVSNAKASTRGEGEISEVIEMGAPVIKQFMQTINADRKSVKANINNGETKTWIPRLAVEMYAAVAQCDKNKTLKDGSNDLYYHFEVCQGEARSEIMRNVNVKNGRSYDAGTNGYLNNSSHNRRSVNTKSLSSDAYWVAYYTYAEGNGDESKNANAEIMKNLKSFEIKHYKEYSVNGRTYWGFDCTNDGDYSDLIFLVQNVELMPIEKRYMVEDLGSIGDFDFNDIVFDVQQDAQRNQKCIIRAMGGTLDFTLQIGSTKWTKSDDGAKKGYQPTVMYNTDPIDGAMVLAEFEVEEWNPAENNVTVSVVSKENNGVITVIPFPKKGEVPMIIALDTFYAWMPEQESLPKDWYKILDEDEVEE